MNPLTESMVKCPPDCPPMKLLLVSPSHKRGKLIKLPKALKIPQLTLHILASLTPNDVDITVVDEEIREIDFSSDFDLVGISCMTATANRSYQLSDMYRQRGSKVVLGGIHPSILPQEAIQHADAVVIGEAEGCWPDVINDFRKGNLQKFYRVPVPIFQSVLSQGEISKLTRRYLTV